MNLLESLKKTQTQRATQPVPGQAANLRQMLAAKSGKAGATSGPAISNVQEQQAIQDFNTQATAQQQQAQLDVGAQGQAQAAQTQQTAQQFQQLSAEQQAQNQKFEQATTQIANNLDRVGKDIESKEGLEALNQAIFARSMADKPYLQKLQQEGQQRRLEDMNSFELEAGKEAFKHMLGMFEDEREFQKMMALDDHEYNKQLMQMNQARADQILAENQKAANESAKWAAGAELFQTVVQGGLEANKAGWFDSAPDIPTEFEASKNTNSKATSSFDEFLDKEGL